MSHAPEDITKMLKQWGGGDRDALDRIMPIIYDDLRRIAKRNFRRERPDNSLQMRSSRGEKLVSLKGIQNPRSISGGKCCNSGIWPVTK